MKKIQYLPNCCFAALLLCGAVSSVSAAPNEEPVRIALMADLAGATSDYSGEGAIEAIKMAIADSGGSVNGKPVEFLYIDHQNKPDIAVGKARELYDSGVDMIINLSNSSAALGVVEVARTKKRIAIVTGAGSTRITNESCSPYSVHYAFDAHSLANAPAAAITKGGADTWFLIVSDFAYGLSLENAVTGAVKKNGGEIIGTAKHPAFLAADFSSYAAQAIGSKAKAIGLSNSSGDTTNSIRALKEFGVTDDQKIVSFTILLNEIHGVGLEDAQGLLFADAFYWDRDEETRAWSKRFFEKVKRMPNMVNAGDYSGTMHYLRAVKEAGTKDADAVMAKMRELPINDVFAKNGKIREDGLMVHDMYLVEVKKPSESKYPWDYLTIKEVIPADDAFIPLSESACPLVKK